MALYLGTEEIVPGGYGTEELEAMIDESGVLDSTEGSVKDKINDIVKLAKWKDYIQQGLYNNTSPTYIFRNVDNPDLLDLDFSNITNFYHLFSGNNALEEFIIDLSNVTDVRSMIAGCTNLKKIVLSGTKNIKDWTHTFNGCTSLLSIETLDFTNTTNTNSMFVNCVSLETVKIVPESLKVTIGFWYAPNLSAESKQSIFDGLATVTTAQTLTFAGNTKVLQSQIDSANAKGWTVVYAKVVSEEEYYE